MMDLLQIRECCKEFNQEAEIVNGLNQAYPYVCSCTLEVDQYAGMFGDQAKAAASNFDSCSETAAAAINSTNSTTNSSSWVVMIAVAILNQIVVMKWMTNLND